VYYQYLSNPSQIVIVTENLYACQNLFSKLSLMLQDKVYMYCVDEITKYTSLATSPEMASQRILILNKLIENEPIIVITHTMAVKRLTPSVEIYKKKTINLKVNQEQSINHIIFDLVKNGYKNVYKVTQPFEFSTRGGVIDIYSINYENPIRVEFFDTEIESIRFFDVESQRTIEKTESVKILPATEFLFDDLEASIDRINNFANPLIAKSNNC
jgi:transcription-repair coupling factor (superfamily II helicase)